MVWREPAAVLPAAMAEPGPGEGQRVLVAALGMLRSDFNPDAAVTRPSVLLGEPAAWVLKG